MSEQQKDGLKRREILIAAGAVGVLAAAGGATLVRQAAPARPADLVVRDRRHPESVRFAAEMEKLGAKVVDSDQDLVRQWYALRGKMGERPRIAGLTTWADAMIMRGCAAEQRLRLLFEGEHRSAGEGLIAHALKVNPALIVAPALSTAAWPAALAGMVAQAGQGGAKARRASALRLKGAAGAPRWRPTLYSWVLG